jgi:hypothetical protein
LLGYIQEYRIITFGTEEHGLYISDRTQIACCGLIDLLINRMISIDVNCAFALVSYNLIVTKIYQRQKEKSLY